MLKTVSSIVNAIGALNYKGVWNASTNTPALASGVGTKGDYYVVSVAGSTNLDGETLWGVGDWAVFNGAAWQKVEGGNTINATTVSASTSVATPIVQSSTSAGTALKNASGTTCIQYGAGGGTNVTIEAAINMNGANAHIEMSPTGTGHVTIKPTAVGDMDNMIIGATTPLSGKFTTATANSFIPNLSTIPTNGMYLPAANEVGFATNTTNVITINSSQNVLIGGTGNASGGIVGITYDGASKNGIALYNIATGSANQYFLAFNRNANLVGSVVSTDILTSYNVSSDYRLKENIIPLTGSLEKIAQLKPSVYNYKINKTTNIEGFIAHELQAVFPHAVTGEKDAVDENGKPIYQGVDASFLIASLTAAIQELNTKFEVYIASHP